MNELRIIHSIHKISGEERIQFTEDLAADIDDFIAFGFEALSDTIVEGNLPSNFPSEDEFKK